MTAVTSAAFTHGDAPDYAAAAVAGGYEGETVGGETDAVHAALVFGKVYYVFDAWVGVGVGGAVVVVVVIVVVVVVILVVAVITVSINFIIL